MRSAPTASVANSTVDSPGRAVATWVFQSSRSPTSRTAPTTSTSTATPIADASAEDLGGAAYNRRFADELLVDQLDIEARAQAGTPCVGAPVDPVGSDGVLELQPGSVVELEGVRTGALRLSRFAPNDEGQELSAPAEGTVRIEIPADDGSVASMPGLEQQYPYRLFVAGATPRSACG